MLLLIRGKDTNDLGIFLSLKNKAAFTGTISRDKDFLRNQILSAYALLGFLFRPAC